jgi:hypothetical protein
MRSHCENKSRIWIHQLNLITNQKCTNIQVYERGNYPSWMSMERATTAIGMTSFDDDDGEVGE